MYSYCLFLFFNFVVFIVVVVRMDGVAVIFYANKK